MKSLIQIIILAIIAFFLASIFSAHNVVIVENTQNSKVVVDKGVLKEVDIDIVNLEPEKDVIDEKPPTVEKEVEIIQEITDITQTDTQDIVIEQTIIPQIEDESEALPQISFSKINEVTREALVNIFCTTKSGGSFKPITGSGVIIDERGVILTNAHVAQYFLLKDYLIEGFVNCVIRTSSPAKPLYKAEPIFISPSWIKKNANGIIQQSPKGTGENDYALVLITGRTDPNANLPEKFPFVSPLYNSGIIEAGDPVLLAAYPAGFLSGITISKDLYISSAVTQIMEVFTFESGALDLFSIGGSVLAQQGSSGGAVVDEQNKLLGIIVTSSIANTTDERDLRAITIAHINRSFVKDTGFDLQTLLSGNMKAEANAFNENIAPGLTQLLVDELER